MSLHSVDIEEAVFGFSLYRSNRGEPCEHSPFRVSLPGAASAPNASALCQPDGRRLP